MRSGQTRVDGLRNTVMLFVRITLHTGPVKGTTCGETSIPAWYNKAMLKKAMMAMGLLAVIATVVLLNLTSPTDVGPLGVLVLLLSLYILSLNVATFLVWMVFRPRKLSFNMSFRYGAGIAFAPIIVMSMNAFGGSGWLGLGLAVIFVGLSCVMISRKL